MTTHKPLPPTRDGFRYCWGEDDPVLCRAYKQAISKDDALKRLSFIRRKVTYPHVKLSESDRAPQLKLEGDLTVTGDKGYCMIRATHCANRGRFYYEVNIDKMKKENNDQMSAARIGWGQKYSNLQAPLGYDQYGYSYRSRFGTKFHQAKGKVYDSGGGYGEGDVIGCMIELPYGNKQCMTEGRHLPPSIKSTGQVVNFKKKDNNEKPKMLEEQDELPKKLKVLRGSQISFYKNGRFLGVAFQDIYRGFYYPSISLYKSCRVTVNFGPTFRYPPPQPEDGFSLPWRPADDMAQIEVIDNLLSDILFIIEQENDPKGNKLELLIKKGLMN
uniref:Set1/Ash2 histone methyltransferase complex subunit ASH2 n=1 Tax=Aceria tosichella TaxID=561515 RepID=A0A6G1SB82_9ACAR